VACKVRKQGPGSMRSLLGRRLVFFFLCSLIDTHSNEGKPSRTRSRREVCASSPLELDIVDLQPGIARGISELLGYSTHFTIIVSSPVCRSMRFPWLAQDWRTSLSSVSSRDPAAHLWQLSCLPQSWRVFLRVVLWLVLAMRGFRDSLHSARRTLIGNQRSAPLFVRMQILTSALVSPDFYREEWGCKLEIVGRSCSPADRHSWRHWTSHSRCHHMHWMLRSIVPRLMKRHSLHVLEAMPTVGCRQKSSAHVDWHKGFAASCQVHWRVASPLGDG